MEEGDSRRENDGGVKEKVVQLSVQSGVSSSFTAFIAVNKDNNKAIQGPLLRRDIPVPMSGALGFAATACCSMLTYDICEEAEYAYCDGVDYDMDDRMDYCLYERTEDFSEDSIDSVLMNKTAEQPPRDPLLQLVSLQKASGCWLLDPALAAALGKTSEEVENSKPAPASSEVWATILALIWLHGFQMDAKDEWELLAAKAVSWLNAQNAPSVTECVEAGNALLGCSVKKTALGI